MGGWTSQHEDFYKHAEVHRYNEILDALREELATHDAALRKLQATPETDMFGCSVADSTHVEETNLRWLEDLQALEEELDAMDERRAKGEEEAAALAKKSANRKAPAKKKEVVKKEEVKKEEFKKEEVKEEETVKTVLKRPKTNKERNAARRMKKKVAWADTVDTEDMEDEPKKEDPVKE